jgi:hypothetical protein
MTEYDLTQVEAALSYAAMPIAFLEGISDEA